MKKIFSLLALVALSLSMHAQTIESLVEDYERARAMTLNYLEAMPEDQFGYKPTEAAKAVNAAHEDGVTTEELIRRALKGMVA